MILVTGATGFIGRSLTRALDEEGARFHTYQGRINDPLRLREALAGVHTVYHLAGAESRGRARLLSHVDVEGTQRLLEESRRADVKRLIVMSRLGADPNSIYPLLRAKGKVERLVARGGITYTVVRSASLFGIEDRFLNTIASLAAWSWPFLWLPGGGKALFQPLWVEDLVQCLLLTLERPEMRNRIVEVAGEERFYYRELAEIVSSVAGLNRIPIRLDLRVVRPLARLTMGWWRRPPVTPFLMNRFSVPETAPVDSVLRTFGFRPGRLDEHIAYLRRGGHRRRLLRR